MCSFDHYTPPTPGQVRAALVAHVAKKLGWQAASVDALLIDFRKDDIARCLHADPAELRANLAALTGKALPFAKAA